MANYPSLRATAARLITSNGKTITLRRAAKGAYDPATGLSAETVANPSGVGVLLKFKNREIDGTTILGSDRKLIYSGDEPKVNDTYGDERIISVDPLDPDETGAIFYTCQLRK